MPEDLAVDNPYRHSKEAQELELAGNLRAAERAFIAAVNAADQLPLSEYKQHFESRLAEKQIVEQACSDFGQNVATPTIEGIEKAYHELLSLPFLTRIQLAGFYARNNAIPEAKEVCDEAFEIGIDPLVSDSLPIKKLISRATDLQNHLADVIGPADAERIFNANFDKLDVDHDGFVHESELRRAQLDISIDEEAQTLIRYLLYHYLDIEKASNDELGIDINGISRKDIQNYQRDANSQWKRIKKKPH